MILVAERQIQVEEARAGLVQIEDRSQVVRRVNALQPLFVDRRVGKIWRVVADHFQGELDVLRGKWLAVGPGYALTELDRDGHEVWAVCKALGLPGNQLAGV